MLRLGSGMSLEFPLDAKLKMYINYILALHHRKVKSIAMRCYISDLNPGADKKY